MPAPDVIPTLQTWLERQGTYTFTSSTSLIVDPLFADTLTETMSIISAELRDLTSLPLNVVTGFSPSDNGIFLTLNCDGKQLGEQAYLLEITPENMIIRAKTPTGLFYAAQTLRQMLTRDPQKKHLPCGVAQDEPLFPQRAIMLDAGRKYWEMDYLYKLIQKMARLKLNVLHLHFSDWNGFRLESDLNPGLTSTKSYNKSNIAQLEAYAKQFHVTIVPEIDLPAHATIFTGYDPSLAFTCQSMSKARWPGAEDGGWTIDYTLPKARQWMKDLINEFIPLFESPYFHIGADEVPEGDCLEKCPTLVEYARVHEYQYPGDVLIAWINDMNRFVKEHGKQLQVWNWSERSPHSLHLDQDIVINAWVAEGEPGQFLDIGYKVIGSPENTHYITPGNHHLPDNLYLYQNWNPNTHQNMLGYKLCVWADNCGNQPDEFFDAYLREPLTILAERTWNHKIPSRSLEDFIIAGNILSLDKE